MKRLAKAFIAAILTVCLLVPQSVMAEETAAQTAEMNMDYLKSIMDMIKEKYKGQITDKQLMEGALKGMFGAMDPYTVYFNRKEADQFLSDVGGKYDGIGIMMNKTDDFLLVIKVFPSSPAEQAGIIAGDKIATVDGKNVSGVTADEAANWVKGVAGTKVTLGVIREGQSEILNIEVNRAEIKINPVTYEIRNGIGYIKLEIFNSNTNEFLTKALNEMDKNNVTKIVLDLRNNPGGELSQAIAAAKKLVPEGLIAKLDYQPQDMEDEEYFSKLKSLKYKVVVLVNGMSASASEILAGAMQDTKAGTLVGTKTFGKAKVQTMVPLLTPEAFEKYQKQLDVKVLSAYELINKYQVLPKDDEIMGWSKITVGEYTTPNGRMIDKVGLTPDVNVEDYAAEKGIDVNSIQKLGIAVKPTLNAEGLDVNNAEKILKLSGYDIGTPDVKLDEKTFMAIQKFQADNKLFPYGVLDFTTQRLLNTKLDTLVHDIDKQYTKAVEILTN